MYPRGKGVPDQWGQREGFLNRGELKYRQRSFPQQWDLAEAEPLLTVLRPILDVHLPGVKTKAAAWLEIKSDDAKLIWGTSVNCAI